MPVCEEDTDELKPKVERDALLKRMEVMWPLKSMARRKLMYQIGAVKRNGTTAAKVGSQSTSTQEKDKGKDKLGSPKGVSLSYISISRAPSTQIHPYPLGLPTPCPAFRRSCPLTSLS